jgi:hypothetical protein
MRNIEGKMNEEVLKKVEDGLVELRLAVRLLTETVADLSERQKTATKEAAHELRDDTSFTGPAWRTGADHIVDHWQTKAGKTLLKWVAGTILAAALVLAGKLGVIG